MDKAERDRVMGAMDQDQRSAWRGVIGEIRTVMTSGSDRWQTAKSVVESGKVNVPEGLRVTLDALIERDETGPKVGESPFDFYLKRRGSTERVQLSSFQGKRPVALAFGSYT